MKEFVFTIAGIIVIAGLSFAFLSGGSDTIDTQSTRIGNSMITEITTVGN